MQISIKHVLDAVGSVEDAGYDAAAQVVEGAEEHRFALFLNERRLFEKRVFVDGAVIERPGVLGQTQGRERAEKFRQIDGVVRRLTDGQRGIFGIDLNGSRVEGEV